MTIHTVNADQACARTFARLDDGITVAHTGEHHLLLNMPRSIDELAEVTRPRSWKERAAHFLGFGRHR